jgi:hypothetical protein
MRVWPEDVKNQDTHLFAVQPALHGICIFCPVRAVSLHLYPCRRGMSRSSRSVHAPPSSTSSSSAPYRPHVQTVRGGELAYLPTRSRLAPPSCPFAVAHPCLHLYTAIWPRTMPHDRPVLWLRIMVKRLRDMLPTGIGLTGGQWTGKLSPHHR